MKKRIRIAFRGLWPGFPWQGGFYYWAKDTARSLRELPHEIRYFLERGWYGITWRDCWNLDLHLAETLPWAIRMLDSGNNPKATTGVPTSLVLDMGYQLTAAALECDAVRAEWRRRLEKMARGFEAIQEQTECFDDKECQRLEGVIQSGLAEFVKYHSALWD